MQVIVNYYYLHAVRLQGFVIQRIRFLSVFRYIHVHYFRDFVEDSPHKSYNMANKTGPKIHNATLSIGPEKVWVFYLKSPKINSDTLLTESARIGTVLHKALHYTYRTALYCTSPHRTASRYTKM